MDGHKESICQCKHIDCKKVSYINICLKDKPGYTDQLSSKMRRDAGDFLTWLVFLNNQFNFNSLLFLWEKKKQANVFCSWNEKNEYSFPFWLTGLLWK